MFLIVWNRIENSQSWQNGHACVLEFSIPVDSMEIYSFRQCFDRVCTVPWCRCVTPLPSTFLFIYRWLVTFFHMLHDSESIKRETSAIFPRGLRLRWIALKKTHKKKQQLFPQLFYAPSYSHLQLHSVFEKHRSTPFNILLTIQPQSHATDKYNFVNHAISIIFLPYV